MDSSPIALAAPTSKNRFVRRVSVVCLLPIAVFLGACVSEPSAITGQKKSFGYSWEQELKLGAEADKEITEEMGVYENPQVAAYVEQIGQRVLQSSNLADPSAPEIYRNTKFTFRVMDSPVVNAFALPGGFVYVTRGLLSHVQNEAQLAVVLGHEIAHIAARHSSQQARRAQLGQIGLMAGAILGQTVLGDKVGDMGQLMNMGGQALEMFMTRYSREAEHESDSLGVGYAQRAGYAAAESSKFFHSLQRMSQAEGKSLPTWQSTHPDPGDRADRVRQLAGTIPTASGAAPIVGEEEYLRRIEGIVVGDDPREGFTQNGVFYHPTLRFQFPVARGWRVENQKAAVVMGEPNGGALMGLRMARGARARDAAAQFVEKNRVQVIASGDTRINGMLATVVVGQATTEQGALGIWNAFIELEGRVYSFLGYSPAQTFQQMRPTFEMVAGGFSPLRDPRLANVQPARLRLVRAERNTPFASYLPTSLPAEFTAEKIAIMNQVNVGEPVPAGRLLKVPDPSMAAPATVINQPAAPPGSGYPMYPQSPPPGYPPQSTPSSYPTYPPATAPNYPVYGPAPSQPNYPPQSVPPYPNAPQSGPPQGYPPPNWPR